MNEFPPVLESRWSQQNDLGDLFIRTWLGEGVGEEMIITLTLTMRVMWALFGHHFKIFFSDIFFIIL
jgi:hypothetical protein